MTSEEYYTFIYEPILLNLSMNANILKMQTFHKIKYDLRGHSRSQIMTFFWIIIDIVYKEKVFYSNIFSNIVLYRDCNKQFYSMSDV